MPFNLHKLSDLRLHLILLPETTPTTLCSGDAVADSRLKIRRLPLSLSSLSADSSPEKRLESNQFVKNHPVFAKFGSVVMISKANLVTYRGPTMVANTLHAAAFLSREGRDWDWIHKSKAYALTPGQLGLTFLRPSFT
ncbi:hypothetical protein L1987_47058 [Smallanthus sonchifolius]|uniref:Uncharacterized protein n=1 Tax=Smallanthus sonchifolius TaxID=185202 RepID=A0ACB9G2H8_9ASTR|nr:hypothetical protein L1987_47058 [Smallanthus sonchifolius]